MIVQLEGKVMEAVTKTFDGKTSMQVALHQKGSITLDVIKMTIEEFASLGIKEDSFLKCKVAVGAYKDNQGNPKLSCKYLKN